MGPPQSIEDPRRRSWHSSVLGFVDRNGVPVGGGKLDLTQETILPILPCEKFVVIISVTTISIQMRKRTR